MFNILLKCPWGNNYGLNSCLFLFSLKHLKNMYKSLPFLKKAFQPFSCWCRARFMKMLLVAKLCQKKNNKSSSNAEWFLNVVMEFMLVLMVKCKYRNLIWALVKLVNSQNQSRNWRSDSSWFHIHIKCSLSQKQKCLKIELTLLARWYLTSQKKVLSFDP